jgi:hypothetical protein
MISKKKLLNKKCVFIIFTNSSETFLILRKTERNTGLFISPSGISDPCGTVAGMVTPKGSMSTEGQDTASFCPTLQVFDMCTLCDATDIKF